MRADNRAAGVGHAPTLDEPDVRAAIHDLLDGISHEAEQRREPAPMRVLHCHSTLPRVQGSAQRAPDERLCRRFEHTVISAEPESSGARAPYKSALACEAIFPQDSPRSKGLPHTGGRAGRTGRCAEA